MNATPTDSAVPTLGSAQEAARRGDKKLAHHICLQLIASSPQDEEAWMWSAATADTVQETISALGQVLTLNPANRKARQGLYEAMQGLLSQDAFLSYLEETSDLYHIRTRSNFQFTHPKDRSVSEPFPLPLVASTRSAYRWLGWSAIGLIPAGLGTFFCAPVAILAALKLLMHPPSPADRQRAWMVILIASLLWLIALLLIGLLILHF